jgi:hypothetical protein
VWLTADVPTLNGTKAKAAIVFGHAWAQYKDSVDVGDEDTTNGIVVFVSKDATTVSPATQLAQTKLALARDRGDEHGMMIVALDADKDFKYLYQFGEMGTTGVDETDLCWWGMRLQLVGWIE